MAKKKGSKVTAVLVCTESGDTNYVIKYNKTMGKLELKKYSPRLRKHTIHKTREKTK